MMTSCARLASISYILKDTLWSISTPSSTKRIKLPSKTQTVKEKVYWLVSTQTTRIHWAEYTAVGKSMSSLTSLWRKTMSCLITSGNTLHSSRSPILQSTTSAIPTKALTSSRWCSTKTTASSATNMKTSSLINLKMKEQMDLSSSWGVSTSLKSTVINMQIIIPLGQERMVFPVEYLSRQPCMENKSSTLKSFYSWTDYLSICSLSMGLRCSSAPLFRSLKTCKRAQWPRSSSCSERCSRKDVAIKRWSWLSTSLTSCWLLCLRTSTALRMQRLNCSSCLRIKLTMRRRKTWPVPNTCLSAGSWVYCKHQVALSSRF